MELLKMIFEYIFSGDYMMAFPLAAIGAGINLATGLGSAIYGGIMEGKERKKMEAERAAWKADNEAWYNQEYYKDYTQRLDVQNTIRKMREEMDRQGKISEGRQAVMGGTNEQQLAEMDARTKATSNVIADLGANAQQRKDRVMDQYRDRLHQIDTLNYQTMGERAQGYGNLLSNGLKSIGSTDWASIIGGFKKEE